MASTLDNLTLSAVEDETQGGYRLFLNFPDAQVPFGTVGYGRVAKAQKVAVAKAAAAKAAPKASK